MKTTIKFLQKKIELLEASVREEKIRTGTQSQRAETAEQRLYDKDRELRERAKAHETQLSVERRARESAESIYDQHRSAVLYYFMAASNPETAKDAKRLSELQANVCGLMPMRSYEQQKQPWEM